MKMSAPVEDADKHGPFSGVVARYFSADFADLFLNYVCPYQYLAYADLAHRTMPSFVCCEPRISQNYNIRWGWYNAACGAISGECLRLVMMK